MSPSISIDECSDGAAWDSTVLPHQPNTFLQSPEWGQFQRSQGEKVWYLLFKKDERVVAAALLLGVNARRGRHLLVPHGPLVFEEEQVEEILASLIQHIKQSADFRSFVGLRVAPLFISKPEIETVFSRLGFLPAPLHVHAELTWVVSLEGSEDELLHRMRKTTRHAISKSADKVSVRLETDPDKVIAAFLPLYDETRTRHGFVPFSRDYLEGQFSMFAQSGRAFAAIASVDKRDVAAALLFQYGSTVFYHHGASAKPPRGVAAAQVLQWEIMQEARRREAKHYNLWGIAPANNPNHPFAGITVFKKGFGGNAFDYMHAQDLPLSWRYWQLWIVEEWRKRRRGF